MMHLLRRFFCCTLACAALACALPSASAVELSDVPDGFWADEAIQGCLREDYLYAGSDGSFGVGKEVTRAEFAAILCRFFGWKPAVPPDQVYDDVPTSSWYAGAVETALRQGALTGVSKEFRPDDPVTREEVAVALVRALGYTTFAGRAQQLHRTFPDVKSNAGYISIAYSLGLMDGVSANAFSPSGHVTREQAAVILMRLHEKLREGSPSRSGILSSAENLPSLSGYESIGVSAYRMAFNGRPQLTLNMEPDAVDAVRAAARAAGTPQLLHVTGGSYQFREGGAEDTAEVILDAVRADRYDGVFLEIVGLTSTPQRKELNALAELLREGLGSGLLYIAAEAPSWEGRLPGYDYSALGEIADRLVLTIDSPVEEIGDWTAAPPEPLEEIYYSLRRMRGLVDAGKLSLMIPSAGSVWGEDVQGESITGSKIQELLADGETKSFYSGRFGCAYFEGMWEDMPVSIWYLNGQAVRDRIQLGSLFNVEQLCVRELDCALPEFLEALP